MRDTAAFVQPIVIARTGTHEDVVRAVAEASVAAYAATVEDPRWQTWLAAAFAKSVRRARPKPFDDVTPAAASHITVGNASALGFVADSHDNMADIIKKMQVSGTDYERVGWDDHSDHDGPTLVINTKVEMSTGKTAAQAAHGLLGWYLRLDAAARADWDRTGRPFTVTDSDHHRARRWTRPTVTIRDAGHTEVRALSKTVTVYA